MRKLYRLFLAVSFVLVTLSATVQASTQDFTISSFTANYKISRNDAKTSELNVSETIVAQFPNYNQNHGILRSIPETYQDHTVNLEIQSVQDPQGQNYPYTTSHENDNTILKIGDPNTFVQGTKTYIISYSLRNVINFQELDEFYWDVNGEQWPQAMGQVTANIQVPASLTSSLTDQQVCYTGRSGSTDKNCSISRIPNSDGSVTITVSTSNLEAYQNLSFVTAFNKGTFMLGPEIAQAKQRALLRSIAYISIAVTPSIITFIVMYRKWYRYGKDPKGRGVIIPEYVSPKGLTVAGSGYLLKQKLEPSMLSAALIELAVNGYIRVNELKTKKLIGSKTDYELEITKDISLLPKDQKDIVNDFFSGFVAVGQKRLVSAQKNNLHTTVTALNTYLAQELTNKGLFTGNPNKVKTRYYGWATLVIILGFGLSFLGFLPGIGCIPAGLIILGFSNLMPVRSQQGVATRDYLLGLEMYIKMAEAERIRYLQSPQGAEKRQIDPNDPKQQVKLFEDLLPYAMLFGHEKEWAEQFKDLYTQPPSWYNSTSSGFNTVYLANSLNSFNAANSVAFTAPSSSSSSGFGGGGFSGGGGGGGGGGGW